MTNSIGYNLKGTKAETLFELSKMGYNVPNVYYFTIQEWERKKRKFD